MYQRLFTSVLPNANQKHFKGRSAKSGFVYYSDKTDKKTYSMQLQAVWAALYCYNHCFSIAGK